MMKLTFAPPRRHTHAPRATLGGVIAGAGCLLGAVPTALCDEEILKRVRMTGDWYEHRSPLEEAGITIDASLIMDGVRNFTGGIQRDWGFHYLFLAEIDLDLERIADFSGASLHATFQRNGGDLLSSDIVGDEQIFSNIKDESRTQLSQLWYEQQFMDGRLRLKLGKSDANDDFAAPHYGLDFINSAMGFSPTLNVVLPSYPDPATGISLFYQPTVTFDIGLAVYDGALVRGIRTGSRGPGSFFHSLDDLFLISEGGINWSLGEQALDGRISLGAWRHTGRFDRFDGTSERHAFGFYAVLDQSIWRYDPSDESDERGIGAFLQYGYSDRHISTVEHHVGGGVAWTGMFTTRPNDVVGTGATWVRLSNQDGADFVEEYELAIELFYKARLTPWLHVQPDLQYIVNPGGRHRDALVGILRVEIAF